MIQIHLDFELPQVQKTDIKLIEKAVTNLKSPDQASVEEEVQFWVEQFIHEVDRIELFFQKNLAHLKKEINKLETFYHTNIEVDEHGNRIPHRKESSRNVIPDQDPNHLPPTIYLRQATNDSIQLKEEPPAESVLEPDRRLSG